MANEKRLIDANALWLVFSEEAEKIEIGVKDHRKLAISKLLIHWCMEQVAKAPKADAVEVVHGRWIDAREYCGDYMCSNCDALYGTNKFNYCPSCGAKMDGDGNACSAQRLFTSVWSYR